MSTIKKVTTNYNFRIPVFDAPGWGREMERNFDIADSVLFLLSNFGGVKGLWENGIAYNEGDRVVDPDNGLIYQAEVTHVSSVSGTFSDERAANPTYWKLTTNTVNNQGQWTTATAYNVNDFIYDGHRYGVATTTYTSGVSYDADVLAGNILTLIDLTSDYDDVQLAANYVQSLETEIQALYAIRDDIQAVEGIKADVTTVAGINTHVTTVAGINSEVTTVAGISTEVAALALIQAAITTLESISAAISTVAGIDAAVTTVAGISSDVTTVAGISANVSAVAANETNINAVVANEADIDTVAANIADIQAAAADLPSLAEKLNKDGSNIGDDAVDALQNLAGGATGIHALDSKATPVDADELPVIDSAASWSLKKLTLDNLKAALANAFVSLTGFRNKIINGNFDIWQRGTSQSGLGYGSADRWQVNGIATSGAILVSRQEFDLGQTDVPGNPRYYLRIAGSSFSSTELNLGQAIEDVRTLAGRKATLTFWARASAPRQLRLLLAQDFGHGGSPSSPVNTFGDPVTLTTSWQKFSQVFDLPSIAGKVLGTDGDDFLVVMFDIKRGEVGTDLGDDTIDLAHVSLVEGDATAEDDPFSPRHLQQELALCQRYYYKASNLLSYPFRGYNFSDSTTAVFVGAPHPVKMRSTPSASFKWEIADVAQAGSPDIVELSADGWSISHPVGAGTALDITTVTLDAEL